MIIYYIWRPLIIGFEMDLNLFRRKIMKIKEIRLHELEMEMKHPFTTSFGTQTKRHITIVEAVNTEGLSGFGECVAGEDPLYSEEFMDSALIAMNKYFAPLIIQNEISHPDEVWDLFVPFKKNN